MKFSKNEGNDILKNLTTHCFVSVSTLFTLADFNKIGDFSLHVSPPISGKFSFNNDKRQPSVNWIDLQFCNFVLQQLRIKSGCEQHPSPGQIRRRRGSLLQLRPSAGRGKVNVARS